MKKLPEIVENGLMDFTALLGAQSSLSGTQQISKTGTLYTNLRWYFVSQDRQLLSQAYVEHGIIQTLVDQPVDDAFRGGYEINTSQLSPEELEQLQTFLEQNNVTESLKQACKWARLFGGGGVMLVTSQNPQTPFKMESINEYTQLEFIAVDMWELMSAQSEIANPVAKVEKIDPIFYNYYGVQVHPSRVYKIKGKEAPSIVRNRFRGWGMSELEKLMRSLNQYLKNQDLIFELLDEAKIDVYKIKGFNAALLNSAGTQNVAKRIQSANMIKNYQSALTMDLEDEYEQKQITFTGLAEMLVQIRQGIAADLKMPVTKLFGISAAGFNSGEDDIENYNAMIEGEIRSKVKKPVVDMIKISCQKLFGFMPDDLKVEFPSLRILSAKDEEEVKNSQFTRVMSAYQSGLVPTEETKQAINHDNLLPIKIDEALPAEEPIGGVEEFTTEKTA